MAGAQTRLIDWTGERCVPWGQEVQGIYEHLNRYYFAAPLAEGKRVLDLASGEGYGSAILAERAERVVGVDLDAQSVEHSRGAYALPNLEFVEGDMLDLSAFDDGEFDLVVCFEALEHVGEHDALLRGIGRVLAERGVLVLSTPDRDSYAATLPEPNPFHVKELDRGELKALLARHFAHATLWRQNSLGGSRLARLDDAADGPFEETFVARRDQEWKEDVDVPPMFYIAVASQTVLPEIPSTAYLVDLEWTALQDRAARVAELEQRVAELAAAGPLAPPLPTDGDERAAALDRIAELEQRLVDVAELEQAARERASQLDARIAALTTVIDTMTATRGWRALQVYRRLYAALSDLRSR
jgi:SAM-dependent methyltransferase